MPVELAGMTLAHLTGIVTRMSPRPSVPPVQIQQWLSFCAPNSSILPGPVEVKNYSVRPNALCFRRLRANRAGPVLGVIPTVSELLI